MKGKIASSEETLAGLKSLLEDYPYFQAAQLLYTLHLQATKDSRFNTELRKSACYAGDRRTLFYRVRSDFFPPEWIEKPEQQDAAATHSPFDRIDFFLAEQESKEKKPATTAAAPPMISTDYLSYTLSESAGDPKPETAAPLQHQDAIDKFLETTEKTPLKINPKDNEPESTTQSPFPDLDTVEESSFFSETLAKIYLKQKKYEKALVIIRQLNLLYPEKNRYFADQIRYLEKLINNIKKTE